MSQSLPFDDQNDYSYRFAEVVIPLALEKTFTYSIPSELKTSMAFGIRVEVSFGKSKLYAGLVVRLHNEEPKHKLKNIISILDDAPVITEDQYQLWLWINKYYMANLGQIMLAGLPALLKLHSETKILPSASLKDRIFDLNVDEYLLAEALTIQEELSISDVKGILQKKTIFPVIKKMLAQRLIILNEELTHRYKPKTVSCVKFAQSEDEIDYDSIFEQLKSAPSQTNIVLALITLSQDKPKILVKDLLRKASTNRNTLNELVKKGIVDIYDSPISRLNIKEQGARTELPALTTSQLAIYHELRSTEQLVSLLHGVTGSGKTLIYMHLIQDQLREGKQVLYLLPEIALTSQIVNRLTDSFEDKVIAYHSRINEQKKLEIWEAVLTGKSILILGPRSSIFLPYQDLGLVIIDEEHDQNFIQYDPAPRYNGRDLGIVLAKTKKTRVVLGSATPAIESYYNAIQNKYHLCELNSRYADLDMPEVILLDMKQEEKIGQTRFLSKSLIYEIEEVHRQGFQTILFQNRRGFAPVMFCKHCQWTDECPNCDITLTLHKYQDQMNCHLCGFRHKAPIQCPNCGSTEIILKGLGTEQLEEEIRQLLPQLSTHRLDLDTARGQKKLDRIIEQFSLQEIDILIGTQMVTKGLDFDHVGLVGVISADSLLHYPDFRAAERAFQLMVQVSGRSGRKFQRGKVVIQTYQPDHPVLKDVLNQDYIGFFQRELQERRSFGFPPFKRLIKITLKNKNRQKVRDSSIHMANQLRSQLGNRVLGPTEPGISKIRNQYLMEVLIKIEKDPTIISAAKSMIRKEKNQLKNMKSLASTRVLVHIDP